MSHIDAALADLRSLDQLAARDTRLARVDARAKVVVTLAFLAFVVSFERYAVAALLPMAAYPLVLAVLGEVPPGFVARKLLLATPFAVMVGLFNPLLDRAPLLSFGDVELAGGWLSFASILLRVGLTVSAALLLVAGTGMQPLCAALERLRVPRVFVAQLLFLYRYAFVLGGEAARMATARRLRGGGRPLPLAIYATLLGHLLLRAFDRAQRVHWAMLARGFDGNIRTLRGAVWRRTDAWFVAGWLAFFVLVRTVELPLLLGRLLTGPG